jgi:hypothetical protein
MLRAHFLPICGAKKPEEPFRDLVVVREPRGTKNRPGFAKNPFGTFLRACAVQAIYTLVGGQINIGSNAVSETTFQFIITCHDSKLGLLIIPNLE